MGASWVQSLHNLHCPRCHTRLVQLARRFFLEHCPTPVYVGEVETLACPSGHPLPTREDLYAYRAQRGHSPTAPVAEVLPPGN